jgi:hypothetical protein
MFPINSVPARVLFDSGASHSFVIETFACKSGLQLTPLKNLMLAQILGSITKARWTCLVVFHRNPWDKVPSQPDCFRNQRIGSSPGYGLDVSASRSNGLC